MFYYSEKNAQEKATWKHKHCMNYYHCAQSKCTHLVTQAPVLN